MIGGVIVVLAALVVGVTAVLSGDEASDALEPDSILLEPVDAQTPDPFMDEILDLGGAVGASLAPPPELADEVTAGLSGAVATGDTAGLYGGSQDSAICDTQRQIEFLTDPGNADKAQAWAEVQGIGIEQIADFLGGLTPVRLRYDTRVTNHSFVDGEATPIQSILQAGTAVLVDDHGVPRSKCYCGNPLVPPPTIPDGTDPDEALDVGELATNPTDAWPGFDPAAVVTVQPSDDTLDKIVIADVDTDQLSDIPVSDGDAESSPTYTIDQLEAALPTDDQLLQSYATVEHCHRELDCAVADALEITGVEACRDDDDSDGCEPRTGGFDEYLAIEGRIWANPELASAWIDDQPPEAPSATVTDFAHGGWAGILMILDPTGSCQPAIFVARGNATIVVAISGDTTCETQTVEQFAMQVIDALG